MWGSSPVGSGRARVFPGLHGRCGYRPRARSPARCAARSTLSAWRTVEWSRSNSRAIWASESGVSSRARNIASCRARATRGVRCLERSASRGTPSTEETASWIAATLGAATAPARFGLPARARGERAARARAGERLVEDGGDGEDAGERALEPPDVARDARSRSCAARRARAAGRPRRRRSARAGRPGCGGPGASTSTVRPHSKRSRRRCSRRSSEPGGRSLDSTICLPAANSALKVWTNSSSVRGLPSRTWTSSIRSASRPAVALLEALGPFGAQRGDELAGEALGGGVVDGQLGVVVAVVARDRAQEVRLAEPRRTVQEERVVGLARKLGDRQRGGVREPAAGADHEPVEVVRGVDRHAARRPRRVPAAGLAALADRPGTMRSRPESRRRSEPSSWSEVAPLDPGPHAGRPGEVEGLGARPDRAERLDPEVEGRRRKRGFELRSDAPPDRGRVVFDRSRGHGGRP